MRAAHAVGMIGGGTSARGRPALTPSCAPGTIARVGTGLEEDDLM